MNSETVPILGAVIIQSALGLTVFLANPRRKSNQCFLLLSFSAVGWLAALYFGLTTTNLTIVTLCIREASAAGVLILATFNLLRLSIREPSETWGAILDRSRVWIALTVAMIGFCQTKFFLVGAQLVHRVGTTAPDPVYGHPGVYLYALWFAAAIITLVITCSRDLRTASGGVRAELAFILIGAVSVMAFTLLLSFLLEYFFGPSRAIWFAPFRIIIFSLVLAYGIATRKILEVGFFLRRAMAYVLLVVYLLVLYGFVWWLTFNVFAPLLPNKSTSLAHIIAALIVAFAMAPARGLSHRLADRLFVGTRQLDFRATMNQATAILKSVTTLRELLERFARTIGQAVNTDRVLILLAQKEVYAQHHPPPTRESRIDLPKDHPLLSYLRSSGQPIVLDELHRIRPTPELHRVISQMRHLNLAVVMGIFARDELEGVMLLGPRLSGRMYGSVEQNALQILCGQLAVAIENAKLFTEVQNAKIYNETLLENLTTGVIAAGIDERITVFNNEAGQITELNSLDILDHAVDELPEAIRDALRDTLRTGESQENNELVLRFDDRGVIVRASTSIFRGEDRQVLGALMVLTDITALKRLELQIRRSDRLASLGTLSAGMAHEIKNPLVSIKTFAQLLPERYQESDFRATFSSLIVHEIDRIDSLVNQLLRFARPAKPLLKPMHVHTVLEKSLQLVQHRMYQKEIKLTRTLEASLDTIRADSDQMEQVFLNFFLNAMDAMKRGGELTVETEIRTGDSLVEHLLPEAENRHEALCISIRDTGEGIKKEDIARVFDPFFTTKDFGTGLGLSVVHGSIAEHGGQIEVESDVAKGTVFHIFLPLVHFDQEVVAA